MTDTAFGRMFRRTATPNLLRQFGETVVYYPRDKSGSRVIRAMVERDIPEEIPGTEIVSQSIVIRVKNDSRDGIASEEVNTGGDTVEVPIRLGQKGELRRIARVISDSNGLVRLLCH
jgi:hypothetical protein